MHRTAAKFTAAGKFRVRFDASENRWKYIGKDNKTGQFCVLFNSKSSLFEVKAGKTKRNREVLAQHATEEAALASARELAESKAALSRGYGFTPTRREGTTVL